MPVYVYKNLTTGERFEVEQRITEPAWSTHPETGDPVKRLIQPVGIAFKGSGFYVTDQRASSNGASKAEPGRDGGSGEAKESANASKESSKASGEASSATSSGASASGGKGD